MIKCWLAVVAVALAGTVALAVPAGLTHHWNFDEGPDWHDDPFLAAHQGSTAYDLVGGADASLLNMDHAAWVSGRQYTGLAFDGIVDHLDVAADLSAALGGTASLSFWMMTTQAGSGVGRTSPGVTGVVDAGGTNDVQWGWLDDTGHVSLSVLGAEAVVRSTVPVNDGNWHHVVLTRDAATGECRLYLDGLLNAAGIGPVGTATTAFAGIGRIDTGGSGSEYFSGRLDQIHVYSTAIDGGEVGRLNDNHAPKTWRGETQGTHSAPFVTESVLFNAYDPEQDSISVVSFTQPDHGWVADNGDGTFTYSPDVGFVGSDAFVVVVEDGRGGFARAEMDLRVLDAAGPDAEKRTVTFDDFQPIDAGGSPIGLSGWRCPRAMDWEGDGDHDLLLGHSGTVWLFRNTGTVSIPQFAAGVRVRSAGSDISLSGNVLIALAEMTGDGVDDLVAVDSSRRIHVYRNTSPAGGIPVYAAATIVTDGSGGQFVLPDQRFDIGDWDGDSLPDVVHGAWSGDVRVYRNTGTGAGPQYETDQYETLESGSYNLYPRLFDVNRNGAPDYIRGINWGSVNYWFDPSLYSGLGDRSGVLTITDGAGAGVDIKAATDGAMVDFADFDGDGVYDLLIGGHAGSSTYIAYGVSRTVAGSIAEIEAIYGAFPAGLGAALETGGQELLNRIKAAENNIISHMFSGLLTERQLMFDLMVAHVGGYPFLQMDTALDPVAYHHLPSIAGQNLLTMHQLLPDTPAHRLNVANAVGLTGMHREIYLNNGLHVGDNQEASQGQLEAIRDFMSYQPRESFPDTMLTLDHYYGDGRGGHVNSFTSAKNTFNFGEGSNVSEWDGDLATAIQEFYGSDVHKGDYFTFVMGHEVTHSLDGYVNARGNTDLRRRWGQSLTYAAGPDVLTASDDDHGWWDWTATQARFQAQGYWDGNPATWDQAWSDYWSTGPGSVFNELSYMRINILFFLGAPQESLATQANHHWAHAEGRLIGAIDRFRRGDEQGIDEMKANVNEAVNFLDLISVGQNKVVMQDTTGVGVPYPHAEFDNSYAWFERNDAGYITKISIDDRVYRPVVDVNGLVTGIDTNLHVIGDDSFTVYNDAPSTLNVLANDRKLEGGAVTSVSSFSQPGFGLVTSGGLGTLTYNPDPGHVGTDSFSYFVVADGRTHAATVSLTVAAPPTLAAHWPMNDGGGTTASDATGNGHNGQLINGPVWAIGHDGGALQLDGVDDVIEVAAPLGLNSDSVTMTGWIVRQGPQAQWAGLVFTRGGNSVAGLSLGSGNELRYHWNGAHWEWNSGLLVPDGTWTFVALVVEPARATLYMSENGTLRSATRIASHSVEEFDGTLYLGWDPNSAARRFKGVMDDFRIYLGAATPGSVQEIHNSHCLSAGAVSPFGQTILSGAAGDRFEWVESVGYDAVRGSFTASGDIGSYSDDSSISNDAAYLVDIDLPVVDSGFWYLVRRTECGSWQTSVGNESGRDLALP